MAKRKRKTKKSAYTRQRDNLMNKIRYWRKKGLVVNLEIPLTEKQLRAMGISGSELTKEINKLKRINKDFGKQEFVSPSSGEVFSSLNDARKQASYDADLAWNRFYEDFYSMLIEPIPYSRDRSRKATDLSREKQRSLIFIIQEKVAEHGERWVGKQLLLYEGEAGNAFETLRVIMYDSEQSNIIVAYYDLLRAFVPHYENMDMSDIERYESTAEIMPSILDDYYG